MSTTTPLEKPIKEDVLPNVGTATGAHKVWCRGMDKLQSNDFTDIVYRKNF